MKIFSLLCCLLSFVYATTFEIIQVKEEVVGKVTREQSTLWLTKEQMNRCQVLRDALEEAQASDDNRTIAGFDSYSIEFLSLLFQVPGIDWGTQWNIIEIISFLRLLDFCDNRGDLKIWFTCLRKCCKSEGVSTSEVIRIMENHGLGHLVKVFLSGFSMLDIDEIGIDRVNFVKNFLPTIKCLSVDPDVIIWIDSHPHVGVENLCNLEELILYDYNILPLKQVILQNFLGPLTKLKTLQFVGESVQHQFLWHIIKQNTDLESVSLWFTDSITSTEMEEIFGAVSSLTKLRELSIEIDKDTHEDFFHLAMRNFKSDSLVKLAISLGNSQMQWGEFFEKFQRIEDLTVYSVKFGPAELIDFFTGLSKNRLTTLKKFIFSGNELVDIRDRVTIGNAFLEFLKSNPFLTVFDMSQNNLRELGQIFLSKLSEKNPSIIKELSFEWNEIPLMNESNFNLKHFVHLEVLNFKRNIMTDSYFTSLSQSGHIFRNLKALRLCNHLKSSTSLVEFIGMCPNLEELTLPNCGLDPTFIDSLNSLERLPLNLKMLDLGSNMIVNSEKSFNGLMTLLSRFQNLERLSLYSIINKVDFNTAVFSVSCSQFVLEKLEFLNICLNTFDVDILKFIFGMIPISKDFTIYMSDIDELGAEVFAQFLEDGSHMNLTNLRFRPINSNGTLCSLLKSLRRLPRLFYLLLGASSESDQVLIEEFRENMPFLE